MAECNNLRNWALKSWVIFVICNTFKQGQLFSCWQGYSPLQLPIFWAKLLTRHRSADSRTQPVFVTCHNDISVVGRHNMLRGRWMLVLATQHYSCYSSMLHCLMNQSSTTSCKQVHNPEVPLSDRCKSDYHLKYDIGYWHCLQYSRGNTADLEIANRITIAKLPVTIILLLIV